MKSYATWIMAAALCVGTAVQTQAEEAAKGDQAKPHTPPAPEEMFKKIDKNGDGAISQDEFKAAMAERAKNHPNGKEMTAEMIEKRFKSMDADNNGSISLDEFKKGHEQRAKARHGEEAKKAPEAQPATK